MHNFKMMKIQESMNSTIITQLLQSKTGASVIMTVCLTSIALHCRLATFLLLIISSCTLPSYRECHARATQPRLQPLGQS